MHEYPEVVQHRVANITFGTKRLKGLRIDEHNSHRTVICRAESRSSLS
jgi:hypothetical protein